MIRNSLGYIARGSQSSLFFQWRASAGGAEFWHGALVPHAGADTRAFEAVVELGGILEKIAEVAEPPADGVVVESQIGIVWHAEGWWSTGYPAPAPPTRSATPTRCAPPTARSGAAGTPSTSCDRVRTRPATGCWSCRRCPR